MHSRTGLPQGGTCGAHVTVVIDGTAANGTAEVLQYETMKHYDWL